MGSKFLFFAVLLSNERGDFPHRVAHSNFVIGTGCSIAYGLVERVRDGGLTHALTVNGVTDRFCGASGDPNYFSLDILLSLAFMVNMLSGKGRGQPWMIALGLVYILFGFMSLSRMYAFLLILWLFITVVTAMGRLGRVSLKGRTVLAAAAVSTLAICTVWDSISGSLSFLADRFAYSDLDSLTSHRSALMKLYMQYYLGRNSWGTLAWSRDR